MKSFKKLFLIILLLSVAPNTFSQEKDNIHTDAVEQVISLFNNKRIVALGENHGRLKESNFRLELVKNPKFAKIVDVIVVEFANPLYQQTIDNYVNGKNVSKTDLKRVWQNTTQVGGVWDSPIYEQLFTTVRAVNLKLKKKIRIIAADPPIDWDKVKNFNDFKPFSNRGRYPIAVIEREVYGKGFKALLIFGSKHIELWGRGFTAELEKKHPNSIAVIMPPARNVAEMNFLKKFVASASNHQLIDLRDNKLGDVIYEDFHPFSRFRGKLKKAGHYLLFLGFKRDKVVHIPKEVKEDIKYQTERKRRLRILSRR